MVLIRMSQAIETIASKDQIDTVEIGHALEFMRRYYPSFWERVEEKDLIRLLLLGHTLFKSNPEILAASQDPNKRKAPTQ